MVPRPLRPLAPALALLATAALGAKPPSAPAPGAPVEIARIDIGGLGFERLTALERDPGLAWWLELDRTLVVAADRATLERLDRGLELEILAERPASGELVLVRGGAGGPGPELETLAEGGGWALARLLRPHPGFVPERLGPDNRLPRSREAGHPNGRRILRFAPDLVLARAGSNLPAADATAADPTLVDLVDADRWFAADVQLAEWNRWTRGSGIHAARDWLVAQLSALPRMSVSTQLFVVPSPTTQAWNVVAELPGLGGDDRLVIVGGHYDSTSENPSVAAPGAEDNASGCAGVLEMARIFAHRRPLASILFLCYSGEEQGLWGSEAHAQSVVAAGRAGDVELMLDMDMIAYTGDADLDCLLETSSAFSSLFPLFQAAAAQHTTLRLVTSTFYCCSDHAPYIDRGMPGLLTIENDWSSYPYYHSTLDLPGNLSLDMAENLLRMNVAAVAEIAGMPIFTGDFEIGDARFWSSVVP